MIDFLSLFVSSFLAATFLPFASEAVFIVLLNDGSNPVLLVLVATLGNSLGSFFTYGVGYLGKQAWAEKYLGISRNSIDKYSKLVNSRPEIWALVCWLPIIGDPISFILGFFRCAWKKVFLLIALGKLARYVGLYCIVQNF